MQDLRARGVTGTDTSSFQVTLTLTFQLQSTIMLVLALVIAWADAGKTAHVLALIAEVRMMQTLLDVYFFMEALRQTRAEDRLDCT
jgi:hypothetical protein